MTDTLQKKSAISIIMLGATGMAGSHVLKALLSQESRIDQITLLGRRKIENLENVDIRVEQHMVDIFTPSTYQPFIEGHSVAICTLGVGEPSSVSKEQLVKVDKTAVLDFATQCKNAGVQHFEILSSVNARSSSSNFYLKVKGELNEGLTKLNFNRLSIFQPSLIITPTNRFGFGQWLMLKLFPVFKPLMQGSLKKYRGIAVDRLGKAIASNIFTQKSGEEVLHWKEMEDIIK